MRILRYDKSETIGSDLDLIEDILNLISTLRSKGYTNDFLRQIHGFTSVSEINKTTKLIGMHIENASGLAEQAFEGPSETSFLPLYYSTLNLIKVYLLVLGKRVDLESNRWHGAIYDENEMSKQFLRENIQIKSKGTIPLIHKTLTGNTIPKKGIKVPLQEIYSRITSIGAEYVTITKDKGGMLPHAATIVQDAVNGHFLKVEIYTENFQNNPPKPRTVKAYPKIKLITPPSGHMFYESNKYKIPFAQAEQQIKNSIKRSLISDSIYHGGLGRSWVSYTPISGKKHVFNEEMCIMLAYFHLSNVVRYNPEHLFKLKDSKYWVLLMALRKHGYLRFIKLLWGNLNKYSFDIT